MDIILNSTYFIPAEFVSNIKYGRLYNWYAVTTTNFAPIGWHVPNKTEFETLITELGGESIAGGKMKEEGFIYWNDPNTGATNISKFNLKGSGGRTNASNYLDLKISSELWISEENDEENSYVLSYITNTSMDAGISTEPKKYGLGLRLIKDDSIWTEGDTLTDFDGNIYRIIKIGNQVWLADNWACTKLNDGTPIPNITDDTEWSSNTIGAYCNYNNDLTNVFIVVP